MLKATIQQISEIRRIPEQESIEIAEILGRSVVIKAGSYQAGDLCVHIESANESPQAYYNTKVQILPLSVLEGEDEMKIGLSKQPWGDQLQLGPYDNARVIEVGVDVADLIKSSIF
jgi:hypothetical protein